MARNRIRDHRVALGISQADLGKQLGVTWQTVSDYERDRRFPRPHKLFKMLDLFGCCFEDIYPRDAQ